MNNRILRIVDTLAGIAFISLIPSIFALIWMWPDPVVIRIVATEAWLFMCCLIINAVIKNAPQ